MVLVAMTAKPISIFVFTIGHLITARLISEGEIALYIGPYGQHTRRRFTNGRINIYFTANPLKWYLSLFKVNENISRPKNLLIAVGGLLASALFFVLGIYIAFYTDAATYLKAFSFFWACTAFLDFFVNIFPNPRSVQLGNGDLLYNNGWKLMRQK